MSGPLHLSLSAAGVRAPYALQRNSQRQSQQQSSKNKRKLQQIAAVSTTNHQRQKKSRQDVGKPEIDALKRKLDVRMQATALKDLRHSERAKRINQLSAVNHDFEATQADEQKNDSNDTAVIERRWYYKELKQVIDRSDILLEVLDARDPLGCRCLEVERMVLQQGAQSKGSGEKRIVLILNKIDLVPPEVVSKWIKFFRREYPCIAFKSSTQNQSKQLSNNRHIKSLAQMDEKTLKQRGSVGSSALIELLKNYSRSLNMKKHLTVGLFGFPNVGKSSIINSLKRSRAVAVSSTPGFTKSLQEVKLDSQLSLIDSPGVLFGAASADGSDESDSLLLRNVLRIEQLDDMFTPVNAILKRCTPAVLQKIYNISSYTDTDDFLARVAMARGKMGKGGVPDLQQAARSILQDWNDGRIPFYTLPPVIDEPAAEPTEIVAEFAKEFDVAALDDRHADEDQPMTESTQ